MMSCRSTQEPLCSIQRSIATDDRIAADGGPDRDGTTDRDELERVADRIVDRIEGRSAREIALAIGAMIGRGELGSGERLPTVRAIAGRLGVSASTVADAWRILTSHGVIDTARRNGTTIRTPRADMTGRYWQMPASAGDGILDLSTGTPDTSLLPPLGPVLRRIHTQVSISSYIDEPVLPDLERELRSRWPFEAEAVTVVDGALDALDRIVGALVSFGDRVLVEDPTFPPILDLLELAGARVIGVPVDADGPVPDAVRQALEAAAEPRVAFLQPRAQNPTGASIGAGRAGELAELFRRHAPGTWIVEDNHAGDLAESPMVSLGAELPDRVVHVHSFSKSHGPDLRIAAIGGAADPIGRIVDRRRLGPSWTSRLIQEILLAMLTDPAVGDRVLAATAEYRSRRRALVALLAERGIEIAPGEGMNLWIPVADEQRAVVALALRSIGVAIGHPFRVDPRPSTHHIRVSVGQARADLPQLADTLALAAAARG